MSCLVRHVPDADDHTEVLIIPTGRVGTPSQCVASRR